MRRSTSNSDHSARAGLHAIPSRPFRSSLRILVLLPFLNFFSRTGAEKLFGFSEPALQIPDRALRRSWLWFDPSALGVNVDRTLNVGHLLSGQYMSSPPGLGAKGPGLFSLSVPFPPDMLYYLTPALSAWSAEPGDTVTGTDQGRKPRGALPCRIAAWGHPGRVVLSPV